MNRNKEPIRSVDRRIEDGKKAPDFYQELLAREDGIWKE
jgi:hypothetical protein